MQRRLPNQEFRKLVPKLREKEFYKSQDQRKISWPEYNLSKINELEEMLIFIRESVNKVSSIDVEGRVGKPMTNPKSLAKAVLFCEMSGLPEREAQGWLKIIGPFLGIYETLDDWVIGEAYNRFEVAFILAQIFEKTKNSDGILVGDGTGLETSRRQNYGENRSSTKEFITSIVDSREIVQAFDFSGKDECRAMHLLIENVDGKYLCLDAGFNDRGLVQKISEFGMQPFVFPKKNNKLNGRLAWRLMYLSLYNNIQQWLKFYHQRSHSESFHSSFKRIFGIITKIRFSCKLTQVTARIIIHNFRKLSYYKRLKG